MRRAQIYRLAVLGLALALTACGATEAPPGRWEGFADTPKWLLAVRLQVDPGNVIHATALSVDVDGVSLPRRVELSRKIKATLVQQWPDAVEGKVDYKDGVVTKAGGYAPLFTFDPKTRNMTFHFYAGGRLTDRIKLYPVRTFAGSG
jgi:hypothetical protein